jgi:hypothetical protein
VGSHPVDHLLDLADGGRFAHNIVGLADPPLENLGFLYEGGLVGGVSYGDKQPVQVKGLLDEVVGALLDGLHGGVDVPMPRDHDNGHFGAVLLKPFEYLHPVHLRHLDVAQDNVVGPRFEHLDTRDALLGQIDLVALEFEYFL